MKPLPSTCLMEQNVLYMGSHNEISLNEGFIKRLLTLRNQILHVEC